MPMLVGIWKAQFLLLNHILKWRECQVDAIGSASLFPPVDKGFNISKKPDIILPVLSNRILVHQSNIKWKYCQVDPIGSAFTPLCRGIKDCEI